METQEIWKDIPGYEGYYKASNLGRVKSIFRYKKVLRPRILQRYLYLELYCNKLPRKFRVNRIICSAFHGLDLNDTKQLACHKDDNPLNNRVDNLFIGTPKDNMSDMISKGRGKFPGRSKVKVSQFTTDNKFIRNWNSIQEAENYLGIHGTNITSCCRGKALSAGKFIWKYI